VPAKPSEYVRAKALAAKAADKKAATKKDPLAAAKKRREDLLKKLREGSTPFPPGTTSKPGASASASAKPPPPPPAPAKMERDGPSVKVSYSKPFEIPKHGRKVTLKLAAPGSGDWLAVATALIDEDDGRRHEVMFEQNKFFAARSVSGTTVKSFPVTGGHSYVLRVDPRWANEKGAIAPKTKLTVTLQRHSTSAAMLVLLWLFLWPPVGFILLRRWLFEKRRWRNSNLM
jgi:hypothetical protein